MFVAQIRYSKLEGGAVPAEVQSSLLQMVGSIQQGDQVQFSLFVYAVSSLGSQLSFVFIIVSVFVSPFMQRSLNNF